MPRRTPSLSRPPACDLWELDTERPGGCDFSLLQLTVAHRLAHTHSQMWGRHAFSALRRTYRAGDIHALSVARLLMPFHFPDDEVLAPTVCGEALTYLSRSSRLAWKIGPERGVTLYVLRDPGAGFGDNLLIGVRVPYANRPLKLTNDPVPGSFGTRHLALLHRSLFGLSVPARINDLMQSLADDANRADEEERQLLYSRLPSPLRAERDRPGSAELYNARMQMQSMNSEC